MKWWGWDLHLNLSECKALSNMSSVKKKSAIQRFCKGTLMDPTKFWSKLFAKMLLKLVKTIHFDISAIVEEWSALIYYLYCQVISFFCGASLALYLFKASEDKVHLLSSALALRIIQSQVRGSYCCFTEAYFKCFLLGGVISMC